MCDECDKPLVGRRVNRDRDEWFNPTRTADFHNRNQAWDSGDWTGNSVHWHGDATHQSLDQSVKKRRAWEKPQGH